MSWTPPNGHISQSGIPVRDSQIESKTFRLPMPLLKLETTLYDNFAVLPNNKFKIIVMGRDKKPGNELC